MLDDLRYPIGKYTAPPAWDAALAVRWRGQLAELPANLTSSLHGLSDSQLDTPYRDGGWTVRQLVHHIADSHLNAYVRFKLALTEVSPVIKPYHEALWAELPDARLPLAPSLEIIGGVHLRWTAILDTLTSADFARTWFHPEQQAESPLWRALGMYAWHGKHHVAHITALRVREGWQ